MALSFDLRVMDIASFSIPQVFGPAFESIGVRFMSDCSWWLVLWRACDINRHCTQLAMNSSWAPEHYFQDVQGRCSKKLLKELIESRPAKDASKTQKFQAYQKQADILERYSKNGAFSRDVLCRCLTHPGRLCPLSWKDCGADECHT